MKKFMTPEEFALNQLVTIHGYSKRAVNILRITHKFLKWVRRVK